MELNEWLGNIESTAHMLAEHGGVVGPLSLFPLTLDHDGAHEGQLFFTQNAPPPPPQNTHKNTIIPLTFIIPSLL